MSNINIPAGTWQIDPSHSGVNFSVRHMMVSKVRGSFGSFNGTIAIADDVLDSSVEATIDVASVHTSDNTRDEHLRSADFFDVAAYPAITFLSTKLEKAGDDYRLTGDLTIKGTTRRVTLDLEVGGLGQDPWGNTRLGVSASASLNRKDFGLTWNAPLETGGVLVGDKISLDLEVEAVLQSAPVPA